jgi:hypothetical protein
METNSQQSPTHDPAPMSSDPIYTDDIVTSVPETPTIPTDPEEIGLRLVLAELEIARLRVILEGVTLAVMRLPGKVYP